MATAPATATDSRPYRFTVRQFERMVEAGIFREGERVELLAGIPHIMTKNEPHNFAVGELGDVIRPLIPPGFFLREEKSSQTGRFWRPEPDLAIVRGSRRDFTQQLPDLDQFAWVVEVAATTYRVDRDIKWRRYAASGIPVYALLDLSGRRLELFEGPTGRGLLAAYNASRTFGPDDPVPVVLDGVEVGAFPLREVLP